MTRDVLIVSDTHGRVTRLNELIEYRQRLLRKGAVLTLIYLGDGLADLFACREYDNIIVYAVRGNWDGMGYISPVGEEMPIYRLVDIGGYKIFMTHGHAYSVKHGYGEICREAARLGADIVLFGHTHVPTLEYIEKGSVRGVDKRLALFNPGSLSGMLDGSFGNLSIGEGGFLLSHGKYHNVIKK